MKCYTCGTKLPPKTPVYATKLVRSTRIKIAFCSPNCAQKYISAQEELAKERNARPI